MVSSSLHASSSSVAFENGQQFQQRLAPRPEQGGRVPAVEQHPHLAADFVEEALDVQAISAVGKLDKARCQPAEFFEAG